VCGDLGESRLGLKEEQWQQLAEQIEVIYHNGYLLVKHPLL
jgi:myxalamid-type nonribosomal peptide synthetase MxaA